MAERKRKRASTGSDAGKRYRAAYAVAVAESRALRESAEEQAGAGRAGGMLAEPRYAAMLAHHHASTGADAGERYRAAFAVAVAESRALRESAEEQAGAGRAGGALLTDF